MLTVGLRLRATGKCSTIFVSVVLKGIPLFYRCLGLLDCTVGCTSCSCHCRVRAMTSGVSRKVGSCATFPSLKQELYNSQEACAIIMVESYTACPL